MYNFKCLVSCPTNTYSYNGICTPCTQNCEFCSNSYICTKCSNHFVLWKGICMACPIGTSFSNGICNSCSDTCKSCSIQNRCTSSNLDIIILMVSVCLMILHVLKEIAVRNAIKIIHVKVALLGLSCYRLENVNNAMIIVLYVHLQLTV